MVALLSYPFILGGDISGASQHHKHIQFIPVGDDDEGPPIEILARAAQLEVPTRPFSLSSMPHANHVVRLPRITNLSNTELIQLLTRSFLSLLDLAISTVRNDETYPSGRPSFNVVMTLEHIHLIPRRYETCTLAKTGEDLSVNALAFAGHLLAKSQDELDAIVEEGVGKILRQVGMESVHDKQVGGEAQDEQGL